MRLEAPRPGVILALALVVFAAHAAQLGDWIVDDAGISFAYARNLAQGHGLVSQPGAPPIEGFSNPSWTLLLALLMAAGAFHPVATPKILALGLGAATLLIVGRAPAEAGERPHLRALAAGAALLVAASPAYVIWCVSGLENPLFALLAVSLVARARSAAREPSPSSALWLGLLSAGLALTRPDGLVFAAVGLVALLLATRGRALPALAPLLAFVSALAIPCAAYLGFRLVYFGDVVPNTYHAKFHAWTAASGPERVVELLAGVAGRGAPVAVCLALAALALGWRREGARAALLPLATLLAAAAYLLLPPDWMGEYRFAAAFCVLFLWLAAQGAIELAAVAPAPSGLRALAPAALGLLLCAVVAEAGRRTPSFASRPVVPFARIEEFGAGYEALALRASVARPSLLAPDLGGVLWRAGRLRVHDLAGLCDRTVARTLTRDTGAFHDYVFARLRPTFIHAHGAWAGWAQLHSDPRFLRDYLPLHEAWSASAAGPLAVTGDCEPEVGDYVRRSAVAPGQLQHLRLAFVRLGLARPLP